MSTRWARFARGWLAAAFATLVAAGSHTVAGGSSPSAISIVIALAFAGITCIALTGRGLSFIRLAASVILSQAAFHVLFSTIGASPGATVVSGGAHDHGSAMVLLTGDTAPMVHTDGWMWLGHSLAGAVTIVALRYGEAAFWRLREIALLFVRTVFVPVPVVAALPRLARKPRVALHYFVPRTCDFIRSSLGLRGPPAASFS